MHLLWALLLHLQTYQLLNCDDHGTYLRKHNKDPNLYRPDICHQVGGLCVYAVGCVGTWG